VRRITAGFAVSLAVTGVLLILPVFSLPDTSTEPVVTSTEDIELGSVSRPAADAVVTTGGTTSESADQSSAAPGGPALTVSRPETDYFETIGITWRQDPEVTDVVARVRVMDEQGTWGEWSTLDADDAVQRVTAETAAHDVRDGTAPYWTGPARGIEAIVHAGNGAEPEDVRLSLIDPGKSDGGALPTSTAPTSTANGAGPMPRVYTRAEWGADESIRAWDPEYPSTIKAATIHHTADRNDYTADEVTSILRGIYAYHTQTRGWGDIGYNVIVDKYGRIFEGR
jgi:hypothetical protein